VQPQYQGFILLKRLVAFIYLRFASVQETAGFKRKVSPNFDILNNIFSHENC